MYGTGLSDQIEYSPYGKNKEYFINNGVNIYLYDFTIRNLKIIIEFNGVTFHANPEWDDTKLLEWSNPFNKEQTSQQNISNQEVIQYINRNILMPNPAK